MRNIIGDKPLGYQAIDQPIDYLQPNPQPDWFAPIVLEEDLIERTAKAHGQITFHDKNSGQRLHHTRHVEGDSMQDVLSQMKAIYEEEGFEWRDFGCYQAKLHYNCEFPEKSELNKDGNTIFLAKDRSEIDNRYKELKTKWMKYLHDKNAEGNVSGNCAFELEFKTVNKHSSMSTFNDINPNEANRNEQRLRHQPTRHHHHRQQTTTQKPIQTGNSMHDICASKYNI